MKIAVFVPHRPHFGNILTQFPLFCGLREKYPNAEITIWSKVEQHQMLVKCGIADHLILYKKFSFPALVWKLRQQGYDKLYNIYSGSEKVHLAASLSGAKGKYGFGRRKWLVYLYDNYLLQKKGDRYIAFNNLNLLNSVEETHFAPNIIGKLEDKDHTFTGRNLVLIPGGGAGEYKRWDIRKYCCVTKELLKRPIGIDKAIFVIGPDEEFFIDTIKKKIPEDKLIILQTPSIPTLISLAKNCDLVIGNDCGPMHIFQMMESPLIMLWGWKRKTDSPYGTMMEWCYTSEHSWSVTPREDKRHINAISAKKIMTLANAILSEPNNE